MKKFYAFLTLLAAMVLMPAVVKAQCPEGAVACSITIIATDDYGDGWNGASISVYQGTTLRGTVTVPSDGGYGNGGIPHTFEVSVCSGDSIRFEWTPGSFDGECSYLILNGDDDTIYDGTGAMPTVTAWPVCPSCIKVTNIAVTDIDSNQFTISWVDLSNENATYTVSVIDLSVLQATPTVYANLTDTFLVVTGLSANTPYRIEVRTICSADDSSSVTATIVRTACGSMAVPYNEGFEGYTDVDFPSCWTRVVPYLYITMNYITYEYDTIIYPNLGSTNHSGLASLYAYTGYDGEEPVVFRTQSVPLEPNNIHISFWANFNEGNLTVGLMTDPNDTNTFIPLRSLTSDDADYEWRSFDAYSDMVETEASEVYVAFRVVGGVYIDDVLIEAIPDCRRPLTASISDITYHSALVEWTPVDGEDIQYVVRYSTHADADVMIYDFDTTTVTTAATVEDTMTIDGLQPNTTYYAWVATICGADTIGWTPTYDFTTDLTCYPIASGTISGVTYNAASISWEYGNNGRGYEETGVTITVTDLDDTTGTNIRTISATGNQAFLTDLESGHTYQISLTTVCAPDSSQAVSGTFATASCGAITGNTTTSYSPIHGNWNYSYSQVVYPATVVNGMNTISGVSWYQSSVPTSYPTRIVDVYIGRTDLEEIGLGNYLTSANLTQVAADYELDVSQIGWTTVNFNSPYNIAAGSGNIVVVVVNKTGSYSSFNWRGHAGSGVYAYNDYNMYDIDDPGSASTLYETSTVADIRFEGQCNVECLPPSAAGVASTGSTIDVQWIPGGDEESWVLQYRKSTDTLWATISDLTETSYTISDLDGSTLYYFRVGASCGSDIIWSPAASYSTQCSYTVEPPYFAGFEDQRTNYMPGCWNFINYGNSSYSSYNSCYVYSGNTTHGTNSLRTYLYYSYGIVATPFIEAEPNTLEISFLAAISSYIDMFEVGLMTNPNDQSTFRPLMSIAGGNGTIPTEYNVVADTTTLEGPVCVAFRGYCNNYGYPFYIDSVSIVSTNCHRPSRIKTDELAHDLAIVSWHGNSELNYEFRLDTMPTWSDSTGSSFVVESDTLVTVENLVPEKTYYVWVRAYCPEEEAYTAWTPASFKTPCAPIAIPFIEDFNNINSFNQCWSLYSNTAFSTTPNFSNQTNYPWYITSGYIVNTDGKAARAYTYYNYKEWLVTPSIDINEPAILTFDVAAESNYSDYDTASFDSDDRFVVAISTDYGTTWTPLMQFGSDTTRDTLPMSVFKLDYTTFMVPLDAYVNQNVRIAFYSGSNSNYLYNYLYVDNVGVQLASCMRPVNVEVEAEANSALVSWTDISTDSNTYSLVLCTANTLDSAIQVVELCTDTFYTFNGLQPRTNYYVYLRTLCDTNLGYVGKYFRTGCAVPTLPYEEDFELEAEEGLELPECWTVVSFDTITETMYGYTYTYIYPVLENYGHGDSDGSVYMETDSLGGEIVFASPYIDAPLNGLYLDFWYNRQAGDLEVGVMTDLNDMSTYSAIYTITDAPSYIYTEYEVFTSDTLSVSAHGYVVFRMSGNAAGYLDDIYIGVDNSCRRVRNVKVKNIDYYEGTVTWAPLDGDVQFRVKYNTVNDITTADSVADVIDTATVLSGLHNGTTYYVWVQTVCADGSISDARTGSFTTKVSCYPVNNVNVFATGYTVLGLEWNTTQAPDQEIQHIIITAKDLTDTLAADIELTTSENEVYLTGLASGHVYRLIFTTVCDPDSSTAYTVTVVTEADACGNVSGNSSINYAPFTPLYNYSFSEMLYSNDLLTNVDTITSIAFQLGSGTSYSSDIKTVNVYMANTALTSLSTSSFVQQSQLATVASNVQVDVAQAGWKTIPLSVPFVHTAGSNLVVAVQNTTGDWSSSASWKATTSTGKVVYSYTDSELQTAANLTSGTVSSSLPNIRIMGNCEVSTCHAPLVHLDTVTNNSATISWMADGDNTPWLVQYKVAGSNTTPWTDANVAQANTQYTINGLNDYTTYSVRVNSICTGGDTVFGPVLSFTTECNIITELPWSENFDSIGTSMSSLRCWQVFHGFYEVLSGTVIANGASGDWAVTNIAMDSSRHIKANIYGDACGKWVATPIIELDSSAQLSFDLALTVFNYADTIEELDEDDRFMVLVSTNGGHNWDVLAEWSSVATADYALSDLTVAAQSFTLLLSEYAGQSVRIAFYAESIMSGSDNDLHIDNIMIEHTSLVICNAPVIASASTTTNSVSMSWTGTAASYEVAIVEGAWTAPESGTATTQTSYTFDNLQPETVYAIGVRSVCGEQRSDWTTRTVMTQESTDGIDNVYDAAFGLFPNPASTSVSIVLDEAATVAIVDQSGRTAASYSLEAGTTVLDLSQCASGVYYVRVVSTSGTSVRKLVVK